MKSSFSSSNGLLAGGSSQEAHDDEEDEVLSVDDEVLTDPRTPNRWEEEVEEVGVRAEGGFQGHFMVISWRFHGGLIWEYHGNIVIYWWLNGTEWDYIQLNGD